MSNKDTDSIANDLRDLQVDSLSSVTARFLRRYWGQHQGLVRPRLRGHDRPGASAREGHVANSALRSAVERLEQGKHPDIPDRSGLWRTLAKYAARQAGRVVKRWRGHPDAISLSTTNSAGSSRSSSARAAAAQERDRLIDAIRACKPPPFAHPSSEKLVQLAHLLSDGHGIPEIAQRLEVGRCTVYRWINLARKISDKHGLARDSCESAP